MKCQDAEKLILLQDSGEMPKRQEHALAAHLHDCDPCRRFQYALHASQNEFEAQEEPGIKAIQNVLREARVKAPEKAPAKIFGWKPAVAIAASAVISLGLFLGSVRPDPDKVGLEFVVTDTQMLKTEDQVVSIMYDSLSEDNLAFNFLMSFEEG